MKAAGLGAGLATIIAGVIATGSASALTASISKTSAAGPPTKNQNYLLCGYWMQTKDVRSGDSTEYHFVASSTGYEYPYTNQTCETETSMGSFTTSTQMFTWDTEHANVNTNPMKEFGSEHGDFALSSNADQPGSFDGRITDYDVNGFGGSDSIACTDSRQVFYASGHNYDSSCPTTNAPGNFNTQGGAASGNHYRGTYGMILYQDNNNNGCKVGSMSYCIQTITKGQTN